MLQLDSSLDVKLLNRFVTANRTKIASFPVKTFEWPNGGADSVVISEKIIWANDPITLASSEELAMKMSQLCAQTSDPDILEICRNPILNKSHPEHTGLAMAFTIRQPETSELRTHILAHLKSDLGAVVCFMP
ncbi:MAG: hypothetical protein NTV34_13440, partial [Proteobacteria bacterium]|nr:hypothetical protein [Pseudomonadota bacterium]